MMVLGPPLGSHMKSRPAAGHDCLHRRCRRRDAGVQQAPRCGAPRLWRPSDGAAPGAAGSCHGALRSEGAAARRRRLGRLRLQPALARCAPCLRSRLQTRRLGCRCRQRTARSAPARPAPRACRGGADRAGAARARALSAAARPVHWKKEPAAHNLAPRPGRGGRWERRRRASRAGRWRPAAQPGGAAALPHDRAGRARLPARGGPAGRGGPQRRRRRPARLGLHELHGGAPRLLRRLSSRACGLS